jgi:hypothetical protein
MAKHEVHIRADSTFPDHTRAITFQLRYWRAFHAEVMTHRVFARNASSSRAIPVLKMLKQVWHDAAGPTYWGSNKPGMQAGEQITGVKLVIAKALWNLSAKVQCLFAWGMSKCGVHKQIANRILEPYQYINVVLTATEFQNFYNLRCHKDAMPELKDLADAMRLTAALHKTTRLKGGEWHLPYVSERERALYPVKTLLKLSSARCARVSYERHDGTPAPIKEDTGLHDKLVGGKPIHASPTEHQILCAKLQPMYAMGGNLQGKYTVQYRKLIESKTAYNYYLGKD